MKPDYCLCGLKQTTESVEQAAKQVPTEFTRLTAQWQRGVFGGPVFGRRLVRRAARGIEVYRVVAFGQDYNIKTWSYAEIADLLNSGLSVVGMKD